MIETSQDLGYLSLLEEVIRRSIITYSSPSRIRSILFQREIVSDKDVLEKYYEFIDSFCDINKNKWAQFMLDIHNGVDIYKILRQTKWMVEEQIYKITKNKDIRPTPLQNKAVKKMLIGLRSNRGNAFSGDKVKNTGLIKSMLLDY